MTSEADRVAYEALATPGARIMTPEARRWFVCEIVRAERDRIRQAIEMLPTEVVIDSEASEVVMVELAAALARLGTERTGA